MSVVISYRDWVVLRILGWTSGFPCVFPQDMCVVCGSFGRGAEGHLLACSQCSQCYHPYCVNSKVSAGPTLPWRGGWLLLTWVPVLAILLKAAIGCGSCSSVIVFVKFVLGKSALETIVGFTSFFVVDGDLLV